MTKQAENNPQGTANIANDRVLATVKRICGTCEYYTDTTKSWHKNKVYRCTYLLSPQYKVGKNSKCHQGLS